MGKHAGFWNPAAPDFCRNFKAETSLKTAGFLAGLTCRPFACYLPAEIRIQEATGHIIPKNCRFCGSNLLKTCRLWSDSFAGHTAPKRKKAASLLEQRDGRRRRDNRATAPSLYQILLQSKILLSFPQYRFPTVLAVLHLCRCGPVFLAVCRSENQL